MTSVFSAPAASMIVQPKGRLPRFSRWDPPIRPGFVSSDSPKHDQKPAANKASGIVPNPAPTRPALKDPPTPGRPVDVPVTKTSPFAPRPAEPDSSEQPVTSAAEWRVSVSGYAFVPSEPQNIDTLYRSAIETTAGIDTARLLLTA